MSDQVAPRPCVHQETDACDLSLGAQRRCELQNAADVFDEEIVFLAQEMVSLACVVLSACNSRKCFSSIFEGEAKARNEAPHINK